MESDIQTILNAMAKQRNDALDAIAQLQGVIALRDRRISELETAVSDLGKQIAEDKERSVG